VLNEIEPSDFTYCKMCSQTVPAEKAILQPNRDCPKCRQPATQELLDFVYMHRIIERMGNCKIEWID
jgi:hypothetical protein